MKGNPLLMKRATSVNLVIKVKDDFIIQVNVLVSWFKQKAVH